MANLFTTHRHGEPVAPHALDEALAHLAAGGRLAIPTCTRVTIITKKVIDAYAVKGLAYLTEDGDGYRIRRGKGSEYVMPGYLRYAD